MSELIIGDTVRLKSGGEIMNIAEIKEGMAICMFRVNGVEKTEVYPLVILEKYPPPSGVTIRANV